MSALRVSEWLVLAWCAVTVVLASRRSTNPARTRMVVAAIGLAGAAIVVSLPPGGDAWRVIRNGAPALYVLAAYWIAAGFFRGPDLRLEAWLSDMDRRWLGPTHPAHWMPGSRWRATLLELAYLAVYPLLPVGAWAAFLAQGDTAVDWYWTVVFPGEGASYLGLVWWQTRPPRAIEAWTGVLRQGSLLRVANETVLARGSHLMNTLPSGHAAGAVAAALALLTIDAPGAVSVAALALAICAATVAGRYHFVVDTVSGAAVAVAVWLAALAFR